MRLPKQGLAHELPGRLRAIHHAGTVSNALHIKRRSNPFAAGIMSAYIQQLRSMDMGFLALMQADRLKEYPNYFNCEEAMEEARSKIGAEAHCVNKVGSGTLCLVHLYKNSFMGKSGVIIA
jgi:hypothetical protein